MGNTDEMPQPNKMRFSLAGPASQLPSNNAMANCSSATPSQLKVLPFTTPSDLASLYDLGTELGCGQFGVIRRCISRSSGAAFACKSISKIQLRTSQDVQDVVREIGIMKHLSHHSPRRCTGPVVRLHDVVEDEDAIHLIMDLCQGGELYDRIVANKCFCEMQAAFLMRSLLETVWFCHSRGIMHRDIKPENILLVDDSDMSTVKLADFGLAINFMPGQKVSGMAGSSYYIAPEVLQGVEYSEQVDVWSLGVILYVLLSGVPPFWGATEQGVFRAIQEGNLKFPLEPWRKISSSAKDLVVQMLQTDPNSRLTPAQALKHPWILHHCTDIGPPARLATPLKTYNIERQLDLVALDNLEGACKLCSSKALGVGASASANKQAKLQSDESSPRGARPEDELNKLLKALVAGLDRSTLSLADSIRRMGIRGGWSWRVVNVNEREETLIVENMEHEKFVVAHDRVRKRVGWKSLK